MQSHGIQDPEVHVHDWFGIKVFQLLNGSFICINTVFNPNTSSSSSQLPRQPPLYNKGVSWTSLVIVIYIWPYDESESKLSPPSAILRHLDATKPLLTVEVIIRWIFIPFIFKSNVKCFGDTTYWNCIIPFFSYWLVPFSFA